MLDQSAALGIAQRWIGAATQLTAGYKVAAIRRMGTVFADISALHSIKPRMYRSLDRTRRNQVSFAQHTLGHEHDINREKRAVDVGNAATIGDRSPMRFNDPP